MNHLRGNLGSVVHEKLELTFVMVWEYHNANAMQM